MPLRHLYCPENASSAEDKRAHAARITDLYARVGLPRFYVSVAFHDLPQDSFFIGGNPTNISSASGLMTAPGACASLPSVRRRSAGRGPSGRSARPAGTSPHALSGSFADLGKQLHRANKHLLTLNA
jgi:phenylpyruvate tautomerase PptA (4-oxalocrotonate tautomerase family)